MNVQCILAAVIGWYCCSVVAESTIVVLLWPVPLLALLTNVSLFLATKTAQEGLGDIFSKFGTSPEELLKEEQTWSTGLQEVRIATAS